MKMKGKKGRVPGRYDGGNNTPAPMETHKALPDRYYNRPGYVFLRIIFRTPDGGP